MELQRLAEVWVDHWWKNALEKFAEFDIGARPAVKLNKRLTATAGRAFLDHDYMDLSVYLFERNIKDFCEDTIPHELAHFIAWRVYKDKGHGKAWKWVAHTLYGNPQRCHNYETKFEAQKRKQ